MADFIAVGGLCLFVGIAIGWVAGVFWCEVLAPLRRVAQKELEIMEAQQETQAREKVE